VACLKSTEEQDIIVVMAKDEGTKEKEAARVAAKEKALRRKKRRNRTILRTINVLVILGLAGAGGYFYKEYRDLKNNPPSAQDVAKAENSRVIEKVKKLYNLPSAEPDRIYTVGNKDDLKGLVYVKDRLAVLYRESSNQLINVSTVTIQEPTNIAIFGSSSQQTSIEKSLTDTFKTDVSIKKKETTKANVDGILVVDVNGQKSQQAEQIATLLKGRVGANLPDGETKPEGVDIVIYAND
jgi:hypothetical protein